MIYVKDYQALNELVGLYDPGSFRRGLTELIGRPVTVFTDGGGASGKGFSGVLVRVFPDGIWLRSAPRRVRRGFATCTAFMLDHITAVSYCDTKQKGGVLPHKRQR